MITKEKSELIGFLCAEGCFYEYTSKDKEFQSKRRKSYLHIRKVRIIQFNNNNPKLQRRFLLLLKKIYDYPLHFYGKPNSLRITIKRKDVVDDLVTYTKYNSFVWKIPKEIINGPKKVKIAFLRGLFDGDGTFNVVKKYGVRARIYSVNFKELRKINKILISFGIKNKVYGPYFSTKSKTGIYELDMNGNYAKLFLKLIKPNKVNNAGVA